jgi:hypothetical protein
MNFESLANEILMILLPSPCMAETCGKEFASGVGAGDEGFLRSERQIEDSSMDECVNSTAGPRAAVPLDRIRVAAHPLVAQQINLIYPT